ncbi:MAG: GNAT family N-acetyltransferase [SAR202 cluster bacterium]|nr:GNAT family N-acetyltransferase [SAR202 cluster bacterium]|tara:strand:- start:1827 stop:2261 length:435 start_codon:yes stop_codon:yes gene_type:complete
MTIVVKKLEAQEEYDSVRSIRTEVFVNEQGVPPEVEFDNYDETAIHAVAYEYDKIVGTGRLIIDTATDARIGRMAVNESSRRKGVGSQILAFLENTAKSNGIRHITLHAQHYVRDFYEENGYREQGETFVEAGILHVEMSKVIS